MRIDQVTTAGLLAIALVSSGCGASSEHARPSAAVIHVNQAASISAWSRTSGPIHLVVTGPEVVHDLRDFHATIVNTSASVYYTGGCTWWDRWPDTSVPLSSCLSGGALRPRSHTPYSTISPILGLITKPGLYRLDLTYWSSPKAPLTAGRMRTAFAVVRVIAPVTGQCPSSEKTCLYSRRAPAMTSPL
jgi:hypothetical protein